MKGITTCNRTACQKPLTPGAIYYNSSTNANYCPHCAFLINKHNSNLCVLIKEPISKEDKVKLLKDLNQQLKDMHPHDGLCSPRDIKLVEDINKFASHIENVYANLEDMNNEKIN